MEKELKRLERAVQERLAEIHPEEHLTIEGMDDVASFILQNAHRQFFVYADYDTDGIMSASILIRLFRALNIKADYHCPYRFTEGYGVSVKSVERIPDDCVCVLADNGIVANEPIRILKEEKKCDVIVLDHHLPSSDKGLPMADFIIDPHAMDICKWDDYCGAGLCFKLAEAVNSHVKLPENELKTMRVMAAIATIGDCVTLNSENWVLGGYLKDLNTDLGPAGLGIQTLCKEMGVEFPDSNAAGFRIVPALNAAGRLLDDGATVSTELMLCEDAEECEKRAAFMKELNMNRKNMVYVGVYKVNEQLTEDDLKGNGLVVFEPSLNSGVIGIIAGKLAERFNKPVIVFTRTEDGVLKGSGRSEGPVNHLKKILDGCHERGLLSKYGGHKAAAGLSIKESELQAFKNCFVALCEEEPVTSDVDIDVFDIEPDEMPAAVELINKLEPYGQGNSRFLFRVTEPLTKNKVKYQEIGKYLKLVGADFPIMCFDNIPDVTNIDLDNVKSFTVTGYPSMNMYRGKILYQFEAAAKLQINY